MADALSELSQGHGQPDPDAQATLNDFLDYTEFFPSDLSRSLTLIGKLDEEYQQHTENVHSLTKTYGALPNTPDPHGRHPHTLRREISNNLDRALQCRAASHAEATRLVGVADNLYNRLQNIRKKLVAMPKPPSREPSPVSKPPRSPNATRTRKADTERQQKLKQMAQDTPTRNATAAAREKKRSRRIIVPGEVLPPMDPMSPLGSDLSDSEEDEPREKAHALKSERKERAPASPIRLPLSLYKGNTSVAPTPTGLSASNILKLPQPTPKLKTPRVRPHGTLGTNAHSQVAGISVSNAQAILTPPPEVPQPGSEWAPWFALTEWELNIIRRKMKKNANWKPSDTMTRKTLLDNGRGKENYDRAKQLAEENGEPFLDEQPHNFSAKTDGPKILSVAAQTGPTEDDDDETGTAAAGSKVAQPRKLRGQDDTLDLANGNGQTTGYDFMRFLTDQGKRHSELYSAVPGVISPKGFVTSPSDEKPGKRDKKRKRDKSATIVDAPIDPDLASQIPKKLKLTTSNGAVGQEEDDVAVSTTTSQVPLAPEGAQAFSGYDEVDSKQAKPSVETAASHRPLRGVREASIAPDAQVEDQEMTDVGAHGPATGQHAFPHRLVLSKEGPSSRVGGITLRLSQKAASAEPPPQRSSRRRVSESSILQQHNLTAETKTTTGQTAASRRGKRSAPGMTIGGGADGGVKLSLNRRQRAPSATTNQDSATMQLTASYGEEEDLYCICNRPSFGTMVACENEDYCPREWFHLECVGLAKAPTKNQKWWCPECREALGIGQFGEKDRGERRTRAR